MAQTVLTERDSEIVEAVTLKVRMLELSQIQRTWFEERSERRSTKKTAGQRRVAKLVDAGLLKRERINAHPLLQLDGPVYCWQPGEVRPSEFSAISYRLKNRWSKALTEMTVFVATERAANLFGGYGGRVRYVTQVTHDLHLAEVYLKLLRSNPAAAASWVGEELLNRNQDEYFGLNEQEARGKSPDAALAKSGERASLVIEFGGSYSASRVEAFDTFCFDNNLPYELW